jgi:hypothetical protein
MIKLQAGWRWMLFATVYPILLGLLVAILVFSGGSLLGLSGLGAMIAFYLAGIAEAVGEDEMAAKCRSEHAALAKRINELMWEEEAGCYWDLDTAGAPVPARTIAPFWTLLARVAPWVSQSH